MTDRTDPNRDVTAAELAEIYRTRAVGGFVVLPHVVRMEYPDLHGRLKAMGLDVLHGTHDPAGDAARAKVAEHMRQRGITSPPTPPARPARISDTDLLVNIEAVASGSLLRK